MKMSNTRKTKSKKIVILTQPLRHNYGGNAQAYALQEVIRSRLPDGSKIVSYGVSSREPWVVRHVSSPLKTLLKRLLGIESWQQNRHLSNFVDRHIECSGKRAIPKNADIYVTGSDQVFRNEYSDVEKCLFNFLPENTQSTRLAYAASFGIEDIGDEYSAALIGSTKKLAAKMDAISVREDSGVMNCKKYWDIDAVRALDSTLLLPVKHYERLIAHSPTPVEKKTGIYCYILDRAEAKMKIVKEVESALKKKAHYLIPGEQKINPSMEQWLANFRNADFVVTDSFHGCVFAIIFHKPFIAIGNKSRGLTRFTSLLKLVGLENRLVHRAANLNDNIIKSAIDWSYVENLINYEREGSLLFLSSQLGERHE